jgi:pimeloyl-ACP methyl ester carboxylesterase
MKEVNMKKVMIGCAVLLLLAVGRPSRATTPLQGPLDLTGTLNGAAFEVRVPANWNGVLLVYAHGYRDRADHPGERDSRGADAAPGGDLFEQVLLSRGYALAGSAYQENGWAIREGVADTLALTSYFEGRVGTPRRTILWGFSLGSMVTLESIEEYPNVYDGAIAACALGAGAPRSWDGAAVLCLAYDVAFGWPAAWGTVADVRDDLDFDTEVAPRVLAQVRDQSNFGRFEFMRLVSNLPADDFYQGSNWLFTDLFFATEGRAEVERRAGGPVVQNTDHVYTLTNAEKLYLATLGVNADALLAEMNARTNISAPRASRHYLEHFASYTGDLVRPVLTIHTTTDGLVPVSHESAYRETVMAAGKENLLSQVYATSVGHCTFTPEQLIAAVAAMDSWLETGMAPGMEFFPRALGFAPDFVPPPYPF